MSSALSRADTPTLDENPAPDARAGGSDTSLSDEEAANRQLDFNPERSVDRSRSTLRRPEQYQRQHSLHPRSPPRRHPSSPSPHRRLSPDSHRPRPSPQAGPGQRPRSPSWPSPDRRVGAGPPVDREGGRRRSSGECSSSPSPPPTTNRARKRPLAYSEAPDHSRQRRSFSPPRRFRPSSPRRAPPPRPISPPRRRSSPSRRASPPRRRPSPPRRRPSPSRWPSPTRWSSSPSPWSSPPRRSLPPQPCSSRPMDRHSAVRTLDHDAFIQALIETSQGRGSLELVRLERGPRQGGERPSESWKVAIPAAPQVPDPPSVPWHVPQNECSSPCASSTSSSVEVIEPPLTLPPLPSLFTNCVLVNDAPQNYISEMVSALAFALGSRGLFTEERLSDNSAMFTFTNVLNAIEFTGACVGRVSARYVESSDLPKGFNEDSCYLKIFPRIQKAKGIPSRSSANVVLPILVMVDYTSISSTKSKSPVSTMSGLAVAVGNSVKWRSNLCLVNENNDLEARQFLSDLCDMISKHLAISSSSNKFDTAVMLFESPMHAKIMLKWVEDLKYIDRLKTCARYFSCLPNDIENPLFKQLLCPERCAVLRDTFVQKMTALKSLQSYLQCHVFETDGFESNLNLRRMWSSKDTEVCFLDLKILPRADSCHVVQIGACFSQKRLLPISFFAMPPDPISEQEMRDLNYTKKEDGGFVRGKAAVLSEQDMLARFISGVQSYFKSPVILCSVNANVMLPALFGRCIEHGLDKEFLQAFGGYADAAAIAVPSCNILDVPLTLAQLVEHKKSDLTNFETVVELCQSDLTVSMDQALALRTVMESLVNNIRESALSIFEDVLPELSCLEELVLEERVQVGSDAPTKISFDLGKMAMPGKVFLLNRAALDDKVFVVGVKMGGGREVTLEVVSKDPLGCSLDKSTCVGFLSPSLSSVACFSPNLAFLRDPLSAVVTLSRCFDTANVVATAKTNNKKDKPIYSGYLKPMDLFERARPTTDAVIDTVLPKDDFKMAYLSVKRDKFNNVVQYAVRDLNSLRLLDSAVFKSKKSNDVGGYHSVGGLTKYEHAHSGLMRMVSKDSPAKRLTRFFSTGLSKWVLVCSRLDLVFPLLVKTVDLSKTNIAGFVDVEWLLPTVERQNKTTESLGHLFLRYGLGEAAVSETDTVSLLASCLLRRLPSLQHPLDYANFIEGFAVAHERLAALDLSDAFVLPPDHAHRNRIRSLKSVLATLQRNRMETNTEDPAKAGNGHSAYSATTKKIVEAGQAEVGPDQGDEERRFDELEQAAGPSVAQPDDSPEYHGAFVDGPSEYSANSLELPPDYDDYVDDEFFEPEDDEAMPTITGTDETRSEIGLDKSSKTEKKAADSTPSDEKASTEYASRDINQVQSTQETGRENVSTTSIENRVTSNADAETDIISEAIDSFFKSSDVDKSYQPKEPHELKQSAGNVSTEPARASPCTKPSTNLNDSSREMSLNPSRKRLGDAECPEKASSNAIGSRAVDAFLAQCRAGADAPNESREMETCHIPQSIDSGPRIIISAASNKDVQNKSSSGTSAVKASVADESEPKEKRTRWSLSPAPNISPGEIEFVMMHLQMTSVGDKRFISRLEAYAPRRGGECYVSDVIPSTKLTPAELKNYSSIGKSATSDFRVLIELEHFLRKVKPNKKTKLVLVVVDPFAMADFFDLVLEQDKMALFVSLFFYWLDLTNAACSLTTLRRTRMCKAMSEDNSRLEQLMSRVLGKSLGKNDFLPQRMFDLLFALSGGNLCSEDVRRLLLHVQVQGMPRVHIHVTTAKYMHAPFADETAIVEIGLFIPRLKKTVSLQVAPYGHINHDPVNAAGFTKNSNGAWLYRNRECVLLRDAIVQVMTDMHEAAQTSKVPGGGVVLISLQSGEAIPMLLKIITELGLEEDFFRIVRGFSDVLSEWRAHNGEKKGINDLMANLPKSHTWPILPGEQAARGSRALGSHEVTARSVASAYACRSLLHSGQTCFSARTCYVVCAETPAPDADRVACRLDGCLAPTKNVETHLTPLATVDVTLDKACVLVPERDGVFDLELKKWAGEDSSALEAGDRIALAVVVPVDDDDDDDC